jgi:DNA (cytosine-5)-methyltransferase 1
MALGVAGAGFKHCAVIERDQSACETIITNQHSPGSISRFWPVHQTDVSRFDYSSIRQEIDLLAGGPPCQPFSLAGKHKGAKDERNMFPEMFRAVLNLKPKAVLVENVRGLSRATFSEYYEYILAQFSFPEIARRPSENWREHQKRIHRHAKSRSNHGLTYRVSHRIVNAADYGIPQRRERVFIVAFRSDLKVDWEFPRPTHCLDSLVWDQWVTGTYWDRHGISIKNRSRPNERYLQKIETLLDQDFQRDLQPWRTVRDAIHDLPSPFRSPGGAEIANHIHNPGARSYPGHTGSQMDAPAKTLKAGSHGVPGGENMLSHANGKVRYFTVRECARLQTFPDDYLFPDVWCTAMKQLGNAVPVRLAELMAKSIATALTAVEKKHVYLSAVQDTTIGAISDARGLLARG